MPRRIVRHVPVTRIELNRRKAKIQASKDYRPVLRALAKWLGDKFHSHFEKQGVGPRGGLQTWKPRKRVYMYEGQALPKRPVLVRSGAMKASMVAQIFARAIHFSFRKEYWIYHQWGQGRMKRPIFVMTPYYKRVVNDTIVHYHETGEVKIIDEAA